MLTDRGKLIVLAAVVLWAVSRTLAIDEVAMAAVACLALVALAVVNTRLASARLAVRRRINPVRLFHDAEADVELEVMNEGGLPTSSLVITDEVPAALATTTRFVLQPLTGRAGARVRYRVHGRFRGRYELGPAEVALRDPFGIARRPVRFARTDEVIVYPPVWALPAVLPRSGRHSISGEGSKRPLSVSGEFAGVRDYVRGDDLRKVHWKTTARRGELMVRQEDSPQDAQATLVIDPRRVAHRGVAEASTLEEAVSTVASAAYHLAERGYTLKLVSGPVREPPSGMTWRLALEHLAVLEASDGATFVPVWRQLASGSAGEGLLIAVVPVPSPEELREMVRAGRAFSGRAGVIVAPAGRSTIRHDADHAALALRAAGWRATVHRPGARLDRSWAGLAVHERPSAAVGSR